jgi:hypothetical protein
MALPRWGAGTGISKAPTGRHHPSPGQRPGFRITPPIPAPTGRPNRHGGDTRSPSMNGRFAIDIAGWFAPSGLDSFSMADPGRCPGLEWHCPVGAREQASPKPQRGGLTGRRGPFYRRAQIGTHGVTNCVFPKPQRGGITPAQGNALGSGSPHPFQPQRGGLTGIEVTPGRLR